jgi:hypothetical protein
MLKFNSIFCCVVEKFYLFKLQERSERKEKLVFEVLSGEKRAEQKAGK